MVHLDRIALINVLALMVGVVVQRKATVHALKDILALIVNRVNCMSLSTHCEMRLMQWWSLNESISFHARNILLSVLF